MAGDGAPWDTENAGFTSVLLASVAWLFFLFGFAMGGNPWNPFLLPALAFAALAIVLGARGLPSTSASVGGVMGRSLAIVGIVLAIAYLSLAFLLPLLFLLFIVMFGWNVSCGTEARNPPPEQSCCCGECCDSCGQCCTGCGNAPAGCCGSGGCGDCGCGSGCDCGGCGDCGCGGGGGCGCAVLGTGALVAGKAAQHAPPLGFAHHPDLPAFEHDVYRVRGTRLCIGCFTTYPVFLVAVAALALVAPLPGPWWAWTLGGLAAASAQGISSAGLATRRWMKATVKTHLGAGLAAYVHGALASPLPDWAQAGMLLLVLGAAFLSTLPRTRRMRKARQAAGCECQARRVKAT